MTASKTLFYLCIAFVVGVAWASLMKIPQMALWGFLLLGIFCLAASFFKKEAAVVGLCLLCLVLGISRFQIAQFAIARDSLKNFNDGQEKITLMGVISREPDIRDKVKKITISAEKLIAGPLQFDIKSNVLVTISNFSDYQDYQYLDKVQVTGKLKTPAVFDDFNYKDYLMKDGVYSVMDYPDIELLSKTHDYTILTYLYEKILFLKSKLMGGINENLLPPQSFVLMGMVFGNDKHIPEELKNQFNATGLSHVTAVSGSNIVILISLIVAALLFLGLWRGQAFYGAVIFIGIYIVLIGLPASGVRAFIMGCAAILAQKLGRQYTGSRVLVIAAALMILQNPLLLYYDVGFQLSFLASLGIILIKPLIDILLKAITRGHFKTLADILSITLAAQIITLPIIIYNFGQISLVAPLTNLLALPAVEALMVCGFLLSVTGFLVPAAAVIFSLPCWLLLAYFLKILEIFSQPWAIKTLQHISWIWVAAYYAMLLAWVVILKKYQRKNAIF